MKEQPVVRLSHSHPLPRERSHHRFPMSGPSQKKNHIKVKMSDNQREVVKPDFRESLLNIYT